MTPQPRRRRRWAVQCYCGRVLLGSTRRSGRGFERYRKHWRDAHGRVPAPELSDAWKRRRS